MFKRIPPAVRAEYHNYIKEHRMIFISVCALIFIITVIPFFEFVTGIKLMTAVGAIAFEVTERVTGIKNYIIAFAILLFFDRFLTWVFNKARFSMLKKAEGYMIKRFEESGDAEAKGRAYACKDSFGEAMDQIFALTRTVLLTVSFAAFTIYVNWYAGVPLVALIFISAWRKIKQKPESALIRTFVMLALQAYLLSLIVLVIFHIVSYGGFMGYYCSIMFKMFAEKDIPDEWLRYRTEICRTTVLEEYFSIIGKEKIRYKETASVK